MAYEEQETLVVAEYDLGDGKKILAKVEYTYFWEAGGHSWEPYGDTWAKREEGDTESFDVEKITLSPMEWDFKHGQRPCLEITSQSQAWAHRLTIGELTELALAQARKNKAAWQEECNENDREETWA